MSYYFKYIKKLSNGFSLKAGPFARWRYPLNKVLYRKRLAAGPEPERPRSVWQNWNYDSEIFAFGKRLNETFNESLLRQAMIHPSYAFAQSKLKDIGVQVDITLNNLKLSLSGEKICQNYLRAVLTFWYPKLPQQGITSIVDYLMNKDNLAVVGKNIGVVDLIKSEEFPPSNETLRSTLLAVIAALNESSGAIKTHLLINDFILTQLVGKDINEIWDLRNPMGVLCEEMGKNGSKSKPIPRLIWSTGGSHAMGVFVVGIYENERMIGKGSGENMDIAEEMAARDALRRLFGTEESATPLPFGDRARKYARDINSVYEKFLLKSESN